MGDQVRSSTLVVEGDRISGAGAKRLGFKVWGSGFGGGSGSGFKALGFWGRGLGLKC